MIVMRFYNVLYNKVNLAFCLILYNTFVIQELQCNTKGEGYAGFYVYAVA